MHHFASRHRQGGAVIVTVALVLLFLLGFMGIALDFGRLFIVKTELQTAMDSCALAAAQELDGQSDVLTRARNAGRTAGNLNRVNLQSANWSGQGMLVDADITFRDSTYTETATGTAARYAQCQHTQSGVQMWLMQALGAFSGNTGDFPAARNVGAVAVASRAPAQTACPIPVALRPKTPGAPAPNYGYTPGEWIPLLLTSGGGTNGYIGWANLDGSNNAAQTEAEMMNGCGVEIGDSLGTPGVQAGIADVWNSRFGIYRGNPGVNTPAVRTPDYTGYAYSPTNWPARPGEPLPSNAYRGTTPPGAHATAANFVAKRLAFASCADTTTQVTGPNGCAGISDVSLSNSWRLAAPGPTATDGHRRYGTSRRIVLVPVTNGVPGSVEDYACMLMLQPMGLPLEDVQLEFIGNASDPASPCVTSGRTGGSAGPLVPALVR